MMNQNRLLQYGIVCSDEELRLFVLTGQICFIPFMWIRKHICMLETHFLWKKVATTFLGHQHFPAVLLFAGH